LPNAAIRFPRNAFHTEFNVKSTLVAGIKAGKQNNFDVAIPATR